MYARQRPRSRGVRLAWTAGILLLSLDLVSLAYWLGLRPFGLAPRFGSGFESPFLLCGFIAAAGALLQRAFRITVAAAILSIFSIGPWGIGVYGGFVAIGLLFAAGDNVFKS